jgi:hypothetical protein
MSAFIGNTAERALNDLACDLYVVKPTGFKNPQLRAHLGVRLIATAASMA